MASKFKDQTSRCGLSRKLISEKIPHNGARGLRVERGGGAGVDGMGKKESERIGKTQQKCRERETGTHGVDRGSPY